MPKIDPTDLRLDRLEGALDAKDPVAARAFKVYFDDWWKLNMDCMTEERTKRLLTLILRPEWDIESSVWRLSDDIRIFGVWNSCPTLEQVSEKLKHICTKLVLSPLKDEKYEGYTIESMNEERIAVLIKSEE